MVFSQSSEVAESSERTFREPALGQEFEVCSYGGIVEFE